MHYLCLFGRRRQYDHIIKIESALFLWFVIEYCRTRCVESLDIKVERKRKQTTPETWEIVIVKNGERLLIPTSNQKEILNAELSQLTSLRQCLEKSQLF